MCRVGKASALAVALLALAFIPAQHAAAQDVPGDGTTTVRLAVPGTLDGTIDNFDDQDAFLVALVVGGTYQFDAVATGSSTLDTALGVYPPGHGNFVGNPSCNLATGFLAGNDDIGGGNSDSRFTYTATQTGDHVLCVDAFGGAGNSMASSGDYRLTATVTTEPPSPDVPGDGSTTVRLDVPGTLTGTIDDADDQDAFLVALIAGGTYQFDAERTSGNLDTSLGLYPPGHGNFAGSDSCHNATGVRTGNDDNGLGGNDSRITWMAAQTGDHVLCVDAFGDSSDSQPTSGDYRLTAVVTTAPPPQDVPGDGSTTVRLDVPGTLDEAIDPPADIDIFLVSLASGGTYRFNVQRTSGNSLDTTLGLYPPGHTNFAPLATGFDCEESSGVLVGHDGTAASGVSEITWTATETGDHFLCVDAFADGGNSGPYTLTATVTTEPPVTIPGALIFSDGATIDPQLYFTNRPSVSVTLPAAGGGTAPYAYTIAPALPDGLTFDAGSRVLSGVPTTNQDATDYTYTATDSDATNPDTVELTFSIAITTPSDATLTATNPDPLVENTLNGATLEITLTGVTWIDSPSRLNFTIFVTGTGTGLESLIGVTSVSRDSDTQATLTLSYGGGDFDANASFSVNISAAAHSGSDGLSLDGIPITAVVENNDASLSALTLSGGVLLAPPFAADTLAYAATVADTVTDIMVTPTATNDFATIRVLGNAVDSGTASAAITLPVDTTTDITILVSATDGATTQTYTLAVTRLAAPPPDITARAIATGANEVTVIFSAPVNVAASGEANFASSALNKGMATSDERWLFFGVVPTEPTTIEPNADGTAVIITLLRFSGDDILPAPLLSTGSFIVLTPNNARTVITAATGPARVIGFSVRLSPPNISFAGDTTGEVTEDGGSAATDTGALTATNDGNMTEVDFLPITGADGDGDYGLFTINADGEWTYTLGGNTENDNAVNALPDGDEQTDTFRVNSVDGGRQEVVITITGANDPPVAAIDSPMDDAQVDFGSTVTLTGSATDPDSLSDLAYEWSTVPPGQGSFTSNTGVNGRWIAPTGGGAVTVRLLVRDLFFTGVIDTAEITLNPVATAVTFSSATTGEVTEDDASMNTATGDLTPMTSTGATTVTAQTDTPGTYGSFSVTTPGVWTYTLDNADPDTNALPAGDEQTDTFTVTATANPAATVGITITITGANDLTTVTISRPVAATSGAFQVEPGRELTLRATGDDPDTGEGGVALDFLWTTNPANSGAFADATRPNTTWTAPSTVGSVTLTLTATASGISASADFPLEVVAEPSVTGNGINDDPMTTNTNTDPLAVTPATFDAATGVTSGGSVCGLLTVSNIPTDQNTGDPFPVVHRITVQPPNGIVTLVDACDQTSNVGDDYWNYQLDNSRDTARGFGPADSATDGFSIQTTVAGITIDSDIAVSLPAGTFPDDGPVIVFAGGPRMTVDEGEEMVTLDATNTRDPEGTFTAVGQIQSGLTFAWTHTAFGDDAPPLAEDLITLTGANTAVATFTAPEERTRLTFTLTVTDSSSPPQSSTATFTVQVGRSSERALEKTLAAFGRAFATGVVSVFEDYLTTPATSPNTSHFTIGGHKFDMATTTPSATVGTGRDLSALAHLNGSGNPVEPLPTAEEKSRDLANTINSANLADTTSNGATTSDDTPATTTTTLMSGQDLLMKSAFHLNLNNAAPGTATWSLWARATTSNFDGKPEDDFDLSGDVTSAYLGADYRTPTGVRLGIAISESSGEIDYDDATDDAKGDIDADLTSILPYIQWQPSDTINAWAMLGYGDGDAELSTDGQDEISKVDIEMQMLAAGISGDLTTYNRTEWSWKASAFAVELDSDKDTVTDLPAVDASAQRLRAAIHGRAPRAPSPNGAQLTPNWELGLRWDDGDAETGTGADLGLGFDYRHPLSGLTIQAKANTLLTHEESGYKEWDAGIQAQLDPGAQGRGITFTLAPAWTATGRTQQMGINFSNALGKWTTRGLQLELTGQRTEKTNDNIGHNIRLTGSLHF